MLTASPTGLARPVGAWAGSQQLIPTGERSGLLTRIATTKSGSLLHADELLTAFLELESAIRSRGELS